jgi:quinol monooxygenase YgiN
MAFPGFLRVKNEQTAVLTQYHVKTSYKDQFFEVLSQYTLSSMESTDNVMAEAYYERGDVCVMWIIERWSCRIAYENNKRSIAGKAIGALVEVGIAEPVKIFYLQELEIFSKEISRDALTILLFVDVRPGTEKRFRSINRDLMPVIRQAPGLLLFQLSQIADHKTRFVVYKKLRNWETFQYHLKEPALTPLMKFLQNSIAAPPFENGYHHLIQFGQR